MRDFTEIVAVAHISLPSWRNECRCMGCLFMLSDFVVYGDYRLWLDNDIIKDVWLD